MRQRKIDPGLLEGEELNRWYRRSADEIEAKREAARMDRYNAFFAMSDEAYSSDSVGTDQPDISASGREVGWREAKVSVPPPAPTLRPGGARTRFPPAVGGVAGSVPAGGFFDTYRPTLNPALGPAFITDLPSPLNLVTPKAGGWFELGDGTLVKGVDEVELLHAEQGRRLRGAETPEPEARVRTADRYRDGMIPMVDQLEKGQREKDATCHPYGGWERDPGFPNNSPRSRQYEAQITRAPGLDYVVRNPGEKAVKFDGCAVWDSKRQLLEAKGPGYAELFKWSRRSPGMGFLPGKTESQARHQEGAARGRTTEWHVAEPGAVPYFADILSPYPSLRLRQTPAKPGATPVSGRGMF